MPAKTPPAKLAYIAVMLVAGGCLLLYLVRSNTRPSHPDTPPTDSSAAPPVIPAITRIPTPDSVMPKGDAEAIRKAIQAGMNVNAKLTVTPYAGLSPLHVAVARPVPGAIALLAGAGADADAQTLDGQTPLMLAAQHGRESDLGELIVAGATVDLRDAAGRTALMIAAAEGKAEALGALLRAGADVKAVDSAGRTAIYHAAARPSNSTVISLLIAGKADVELADTQGVTPLMKAAEQADAEQVVQLLNAGASPGGKSRDGRSALDRAKGRTDETGRAVAGVLDQAGS